MDGKFDFFACPDEKFYYLFGICKVLKSDVELMCESMKISGFRFRVSTEFPIFLFKCYKISPQKVLFVLTSCSNWALNLEASLSRFWMICHARGV
jgi:hypothetical protein